MGNWKWKLELRSGFLYVQDIKIALVCVEISLTVISTLTFKLRDVVEFSSYKCGAA